MRESEPKIYIKTESSYDLLNQIYFGYLQELYRSQLGHSKQKLTYSPNINYYQQFYLPILRQFANEPFQERYTDVYLALFENNNQALEKTFAAFVAWSKKQAEELKEDGQHLERPTHLLAKHQITEVLVNSRESSKRGPEQSEHWYKKICSVLGNINTMFSTSVPSIRKYKCAQHQKYIELRMGAQGIVEGHFGARHVRVNPLFEHYLEAKRLKYQEAYEQRQTDARLLEEKARAYRGNLQLVKSSQRAFSSKKEREERVAALKEQAEALEEKARTLRQQPECPPHLYINLLKRKTKKNHSVFYKLRHLKTTIKSQFETGREDELSRALHDAEARHSNLFVVSLPAHDELTMLGKTKLGITPNTIPDKIFTTVCDSIANNTNCFQISDKAFDLLFPHLTGEHEPGTKASRAAKVLQPLFERSLTDLGLTASTRLNEQQLQAFMSHFIRYELTALLFKCLQPQTANFTCKDGIDRGASHSLIYNLFSSMKAVERGEQSHIISEAEFMEGLHAAAMHVKGRGMNFHIETVWNTLETYIRHQLPEFRRKSMSPEKIKQIIPDYLIEWLKENVPESKRKTGYSPCYGEPYDFEGLYDRHGSIEGSSLNTDYFKKPCLEHSRSEPILPSMDRPSPKSNLISRSLPSLHSCKKSLTLLKN